MGIDRALAGGWIEVACNAQPPGEVVVSMRPVSVFANGPEASIEHLRTHLRGQRQQTLRAMMVLLSVHGLSPVQIAELLDCDPSTVRRWIVRFNQQGPAGLADRPRPGRPRIGGPRLLDRIAALLERAGPWTVPRLWQYLGRPKLSPRTLYRRLRVVAIWRRPKLVAAVIRTGGGRWPPSPPGCARYRAGDPAVAGR